MSENNCPKDGIRINGRCVSHKILLKKLESRETRKVKQMLKQDGEFIVKKLKNILESGAVDTQEVWEQNNFMFAKAFISASSKGFISPVSDEGKIMESNLRSFF